MRQSLVLAVCVSFIGATELAAENEFVRPTRALAKTSTDLQIRLKIVIAEVNKGDWPEVEKISSTTGGDPIRSAVFRNSADP